MAKNIPTDLLRSFVTVVDLGGFTRAAEALGRTQPAISLQIRRLEELLNTKLIRTAGRQFALTDEAIALGPYARQLLRLNDDIVAHFADAALSGWIRVGVPTDFAHSFLLEAIAGELGEASADDAWATPRTDGSWLMDGLIPAHELKGEGYLMMPAGRLGPAFIVTPNFYVLKDYNESDLYALFVGHVGDRIEWNVGDFTQGWGKIDKLWRSDIAAMQRVLERQGHDVGGADGLPGFKTRRSIGAWQAKNGRQPTCFPDAELIRAIR